MDIWGAVKEYFEEDDGSLPDIFIVNLTHKEEEDIFNWILSITEPFDNSEIYSIREDKNFPLKYYKNPVSAVITGEVYPFRLGLNKFIIKNVTIPQLTILISINEIEFDYRMGKQWGPEQVEALFEFLALIKDKAPSARIIQAYEGGLYNRPNIEFTTTFEDYYSNRLGLR